MDWRLEGMEWLVEVRDQSCPLRGVRPWTRMKVEVKALSGSVS